MEERDKKRIKYSIIILLLVLISIFAISYFPKNNNKEGSQYYNNFLVQKTQLGYITSLYIGDKGPYSIETKYHPKDVENITIDFDVKKIIKGKEHVYVAIDPYDTRLTGQTTIAGMELKAILEPFFKIWITSAFTTEKGGYIIKNCLEQNKTEAVFLLELGDETRIFKNDNCITLRAKTQEDIIREADAIIFNSLGITK
ncbi:hypothetical protein J4409_02625 [Candidatus Woesearchaeota archaeon]|nr:hypothetical protein [Candidatus Woesearchaeota archaeon]